MEKLKQELKNYQLNVGKLIYNMSKIVIQTIRIIYTRELFMVFLLLVKMNLIVCVERKSKELLMFISVLKLY
jgi:hypothetical protein